MLLSVEERAEIRIGADFYHHLSSSERAKVRQLVDAEDQAHAAGGPPPMAGRTISEERDRIMAIIRGKEPPAAPKKPNFPRKGTYVELLFDPATADRIREMAQREKISSFAAAVHALVQRGLK